MRLSELIAGCGVLRISGNADTEIRNLAADSREVGAGTLFVAVKGCTVDGHDYISRAVRAGAAAVVYEDAAKAEAEVGAVRAEAVEVTSSAPCLVQVADTRIALGLLASAFYGKPSEKLNLVGITGTNGKTTTATLLYRLFTELGYSCGLLSTIANYVGRKELPTGNTTSDPLTTNRLLSAMADEGCEYCFMEVSSIGMAQERTAGLRFRGGIFSNLTHDHLDYHRTFAEYLRCKKLFFDRLPGTAFALTNLDDRNGRVMVQNTEAEVITYACRTMADHRARVVEEHLDGMWLEIDGKEMWTRLTGRHNACNLLAAYAAAVALGAEPEEVLTVMSGIAPVKGRSETLRGPGGLTAVIDYAHTPDALEHILRTLREIVPDKPLLCLFGCGGDRDKGKRPEMAQVAEKYADRIFVTSDNSRTERTEDILADIRAGFSPAGLRKAVFIADRREAIRTAVLLAGAGSTLLLAGKGHETCQIIGGECRPFDEREILREVFREMDPPERPERTDRPERMN